MVSFDFLTVISYMFCSDGDDHAKELDDNVDEDCECYLATAPTSDIAIGYKFSFLERFPAWATLESMEAFKVMPQNPHFRTLTNYGMICHESIAIGLMFRFVSWYERVSSLQVDDSHNIFPGCLEVISELEPHGFNVTVLRDRICGMLSIIETKNGLHESLERLETVEVRRSGVRETLWKERKDLEPKMVEVDARIRDETESLLELNSEISSVAKGIKSSYAYFEEVKHPTS